MTNAIIDTALILCGTFGAIGLAYTAYAILWLPAYLLGYRKTEKNPKEM